MAGTAIQARNQIILGNGVILPVIKVRMKRTADGRFVTVSGDEDAQDDIGTVQPDGTIYLGQYQPTDCDGKSLSKTFNVYAAPEDLPDTMKYVDAVKYISSLRSWNGHDGTNYKSDKEIYQALKDGSYNGGWIIPTRVLLIGTEADDRTDKRASTAVIVQPDNLYDHREKGALKGTFCRKAASGDCPQRYWSCTHHDADQYYVWYGDFSNGGEGWGHNDDVRFSCRPVRLAELKGP